MIPVVVVDQHLERIREVCTLYSRDEVAGDKVGGFIRAKTHAWVTVWSIEGFVLRCHRPNWNARCGVLICIVDKVLSVIVIVL